MSLGYVFAIVKQNCTSQRLCKKYKDFKKQNLHHRFQTIFWIILKYHQVVLESFDLGVSPKVNIIFCEMTDLW